MKSSIIWAALALMLFVATQLKSQDTIDHRNLWTGGQKGHVVFGDLTPLKGQTTFNIIVDPHVEKMGAAEEPDSVYIAKRVAEWNADKKGKGDVWLSSWKNSSANFKPVFIAGMNRQLVKCGVTIGLDDSMAEYTFIVYTRSLMDFMNRTFIILDVKVVLTTDPDVQIAFIRCPVNNSALGDEYCTSEYEKAYYSGGYLLGRFLRKGVFKE
jgi:hypothetical protein